MEEENNNMLPFLEELIEKGPSFFVTGVYRKSTFTGLYISWDSVTSKSWKINLVKFLTYRALIICSNI